MPINWDAPIQIRDGRNGNWFWVDKEIWSDERLTSSDKVVYGTLAFYANQKDQTAFPSISSLQNNCKLSKRQIYISLKKLESVKHLKIIRKQGKPNEYTLLDNGINHLKEGSANSAPVHYKEKSMVYSAPPPVQNEERNNIYTNKNNITIPNTNVLGVKPQFGNPDINLCLEELTKLLGNRPTKETLNRYAVKRLIIKLGNVGRVLAAINYAFKIREEDKYAPRIYNFMDLEEKLEHLKGYGKQKTKSKAVNVEEGIKYLEGKNPVSMLTKYNSDQANWRAVTYDDYEYFWSDAEYEVYKKATENAELKILHFKDGSLAIADIRRVEPYVRPTTWEERTGVDTSKLTGSDPVSTK